MIGQGILQSPIKEWIKTTLQSQSLWQKSKNQTELNLIETYFSDLQEEIILQFLSLENI